MTAGEGYRFTADAVLAVARRIAAGSALPGSMTAIRRFGPEFLEALPGVALTTVEGIPAHA
jgi:glycerol-3-phosphate responsive antiterminator